MEFAWYRCWRGDHTKGDHHYQPRSDAQGKQWAKERLAPLQAQIAAFFGLPDGDIEALREGVMKLFKREPIICRQCGKDLLCEPHTDDCDLAKQFRDVLQSISRCDQYASPDKTGIDKPHTPPSETQPT